MTKSEILKDAILEQYKSIRAFCNETGIPYSTLVTALDRGIEGMAYGTVLRMCERLNLSPADFSGIEELSGANRKLYERKLISSFARLNKDGRRKILELMDDYAMLEKYQADPSRSR
ncbi:MAG: transcriptional regulator [Lachnospiraceae bacterium]|nr:transcriptional regulator [Lachnospiraceae bacterium]